jgi:hypothetical protein
MQDLAGFEGWVALAPDSSAEVEASLAGRGSNILALVPALETPGYFRTSLRGFARSRLASPARDGRGGRRHMRWAT